MPKDEQTRKTTSKKAGRKAAPAAAPAGAPSSGGAKQGGVSEEAVLKATGLGWEPWFARLDKARMHERDHKRIAAWIAEEQPDVSGWWAQMITVAYEQARGLRAKHEKPSGFSAGVSKTLPVDLDTLYAAWSDARKRKRWLGDARLTVRKAAPAKSMRITWEQDGSSVNVYFWDKGPGKSQVQVEHEKLASPGDVAAKKELWKEAFGRLAAQLEA